jgi:hypothetical protein
MTPEELQPLIDALGLDRILEDLMEFGGKEGGVYFHNTRNGAKTATEIGLHYSGAHWYARMSIDSGGDSYSLGYQRDGTAHFCQTFAVMIFTGNDGALKNRSYVQNIEKAMDFLMAYLKNVKKDKAMKDWLSDRLMEVDLSLAEFELKILQARGDAATISHYQ